MKRIPVLAAACLALALVLPTRVTAQSSGTLLYDYISLSPGALTTQLASINADGTNDRFFNLPLLNPSYPVWSRNGEVLAVAATDPARPDKWSTDIFVVQRANGQITKVSGFEDIAGASGFATFYPSYLALAPDGKRIAAGMVSYLGARSTVIFTNTAGQAEGPYDTRSHVSRCVSLLVFEGNGLAPFLVTSALCDDDNAHPGEGVDWSPTQNLLAYPYNTSTVFFGAGGTFPITAIHLIEPSPMAADQGRHKQLTFPAGQTGGPFDSVSLAWFDDFAPAFSPDGKQVAYVRLFTAVSSLGVKQLSTPAIRLIGVDGLGDREIAHFEEGAYITRLSWSPDGTQLAFDLVRQAVRDGFPLRTFDLGSVTLAKINVDGTGFSRVRGAPATWPTWFPQAAAAPAPPRLGVELLPINPPSIRLSWPDANGAFFLEVSSRLGPNADWKRLELAPVRDGAVSSAAVSLSGSGTFYRLRQP